MDVDEFLAHHGVKGMKWGVRKDAGHEGERAKTKKIEKLDRKFTKEANSFSNSIRLHNRAAELSNKNDVVRINNDPKYKNMDFSRDTPLRQKYYKEHQDAFVTNLKKAADEIGTNASGTKKYGVFENLDGSWDVTVDEVKHADTQERFTVKVKYSSRGHILELKVPEEELKQADDAGDFLEHYGVKGMRWGKRRAEQQAERASTQSKDHAKSSNLKKKRLDEMSNAELEVLNKRMNLEQQYSKLNPKKSSAGKKFAQDVVREIAKEQVKALAKKGLTSAGKAVVDYLVKN